MAYNHRQSMAGFGHSSQSRTPANSNRRQQAPADESEFLLMSASEIAAYLTDTAEIRITESDLHRPSAAQIQVFYEFFIDFFHGLRRETVDPIVEAASEDLDYKELLTDGMKLMAPYRKLLQLMDVCGVKDFGAHDLFRPDSQRTIRIFSHVINFFKFVEQNALPVFKEQNNLANNVKARVDQLIDENAQLEAEIAELEERRRMEKPRIAELTQINVAKTNELRESARKEKSLKATIEKLKKEKTQLVGNMKVIQEHLVTVQQESAKLSPYVLESPEMLQSSIQVKTSKLLEQRNEVDLMERQSRALQNSADSFSLVEEEVKKCVLQMEEIAADMLRADELASKAARHTNALDKKKAEVTSIQRTEALLLRQIESAKERIEQHRKAAGEKAQQAQERMNELHRQYKQLTQERNEKNTEMDKKRMETEQIEKKMNDLREHLEAEISAAHQEFAKFRSQVELYITTMSNHISKV